MKDSYSLEYYEGDCFPEKFSDAKPEKETGKLVPGVKGRETDEEDENITAPNAGLLSFDCCHDP